MPRKKKPVNAMTVKFRKRPMLTRARGNPKLGKHHQLAFGSFVHGLFKLNETLKRGDKATDGGIAATIYEEFKHDEELAQRFSPSNEKLGTVISELRSRYNRGKLTQKDGPPPPSLVSLSYNENGDPINPRYAKPKLLTAREIHFIRHEKHKKLRTAWENSRGS